MSASLSAAGGDEGLDACLDVVGLEDHQKGTCGGQSEPEVAFGRPAVEGLDGYRRRFSVLMGELEAAGADVESAGCS